MCRIFTQVPGGPLSVVSRHLRFRVLPSATISLIVPGSHRPTVEERTFRFLPLCYLCRRCNPGQADRPFCPSNQSAVFRSDSPTKLRAPTPKPADQSVQVVRLRPRAPSQDHICSNGPEKIMGAVPKTSQGTDPRNGLFSSGIPTANVYILASKSSYRVSESRAGRVPPGGSQAVFNIAQESDVSLDVHHLSATPGCTCFS